MHAHRRFVSSVAVVLLALTAPPVAAADAPPVERGDPASRVARDAAHNEAWDLTAQFESGHWVIARFMITRDGPGSQTGLAVGTLGFPDGRVVPFQNGRQAGDWTLAPDGLQLDIGSSDLLLRGATRRLDVDNDKRGIKIHLQFASGPPASWAGPGAPTGLWLDVIELGTPVTGTVWAAGMAEAATVKGRLTATHSWMAAGEAETLHRLLEVLVLRDDLALYVASVTPPTGAQRHWLAARHADSAFDTTEFELALGAALGAEPSPKYPVPRTIYVRGAAITAEVRNHAELLRYDPLDAIPNPFRFFLSLRSRPQRVWARAAVEVHLAARGDTAGASITGAGLTALSYSNPFQDGP